jgi:saccharopine dehydrogenase-like NADP-dependent oxidoreductase
MKQVLVIGAGLSSTYLIKYLEENATKFQWKLTVADRDIEVVNAKCLSQDTIKMVLDISDTKAVKSIINSMDLVVSMLPAFLHMEIAKICLEKEVHLATASYLSDELKELDEEVRNSELVFLNECGLDPGIDHLSAMKILDGIRDSGGEITEFESFTGGLIAPDCEDNPWKYKFTWNPRNVILAASGGAVKFVQEGKYKYIPYHKVFRRTEIIEIDGYGKFEGYANRDSLTYREAYKLDHVKTMYRGTLRRPGFSKAWNCFVQLGATDDSYHLENSEDMTHRDFVNTFLAYHPTDSVELKLKQYLRIAQDDVNLWERIVSTGIFSNEKVGLKNATPAQILQKILEKSWGLKEDDRDMIVMWHKVTYNINNVTEVVESSLVCEGESRAYTAMAKTVGLPLAIACKLILTDAISARGCMLPLSEEFYNPVLEELEANGIFFKETKINKA